MRNLISISELSKTYAGGFQALKGINLDIYDGEILALLGPNGAGKTTLISIICGIVTPSMGSVHVDGHDIIKDFRITRSKIGLVPQELMLDIFESVWDSLNFSRGLFGKPPNDEYLLWLLDSLSLTEKRDEPIFRLSGGMKRRALIAKALAHQPELIFLDEPTAGVDVSLRKNMWKLVEKELTLKGFLLYTYMDSVPAASAQLHEWVRSGEIHILENITEGLPNAGWAYSEMMRGATMGKNLVAMDLKDGEQL